MQTMKSIQEEFENSSFWRFVGFEFVEVSERQGKIKLQFQQNFENVRKMMHGGMIMSMLDTVMGLTTRGKGYDEVATIQMETRFIEPVRSSELTAIGEVLYVKNKTAIVKGEIYNEDGQVVAFSTATFLISKK